MAGISFGNVGGFSKGPAAAPRPARPAVPAPGASLTGLRAPGQGSGFMGLTAAARPRVSPTQSAAPTTTATPTSGGTSTGPSSPLDATYYANLAANQLKVGNQINGLTAQSQNANTALQAALGQLAYQQPRDQLRVEEAANNRGALYSSVEAQQQGNLLNQYQTKQSGLTSGNAEKQAAIAAQIAALQQGQPLYADQQYDDAVARAIKAAASNPATGQATTASSPSTPAPVTSILGTPIPPGLLNRNGTLKVSVPKVRPGQIGYRGGF